MAVIPLSEPVAAISQSAVYNQNIGGLLNRSASLSVPGGIHWAVVGCVLADAATPENVESTLVPAVTALTQVTSVHGDQLYGKLADTVEQAEHEFALHVTSSMSVPISSGAGVFTQVARNHRTIKPPVAKKWCVLILRVPAALDATKITALQNAITGINGVTTTVCLMDGTIPVRASGDATLQIAAHVRIESVEA